MSERRYAVDSIRDFAYMDKQLGRLRQWLEGFKEGGGLLPHDFDVLRQCQIALRSAKPLRVPSDTRLAAARLAKALTALDDASDEVHASASAMSAMIEDASADTHPKDGDVKQAPLVSGAVPSETSADAQTTEDENGNATSGNPLSSNS